MFLLQLMIAFAIAAPTEASLPRFLSSGINKVDGVQNTDTPKLSPNVVVIIVLLAVVFFFSGLLHIVARCLVRYSQTRHNSSNNANANANASILHGQLQHLFSLHDSGVEQAFIDALPVFFYKSVQGLKDAADCAVCLSEFHGDDRLRLLPNCSHAFHIDCIDTWLLSHSTCPLCRRSLLPDPIATQSLQVDADRDEALPHIRTSNISDQALAMDPAAGEEGSDSAELQSIQPTSQKGSTLVSVQLGRFCPMAAAADAGMENVMGTNSSSGRRSYSMGSYEYVIDPSNLQVVVAPTPVHRRWANWKLPPTPGHKSALSDFTPHCSVEDPSPGFSEELSVASSCFCPRDASAYSKHKTRSRPPSQETTKTANTVDGDGGQMKRAVSFGVSNADVKLMQSPVCEANSIEVVDVECSPRVSIQNGGGVGSRRYLIARKTLHWLMGRERRFVYPAVNP